MNDVLMGKKAVLATGMNGIVLASNMGGDMDVVVKTTLPDENTDSIRYEYFVNKQLNDLHEYVPNFPIAYNLITCPSKLKCDRLKRTYSHLQSSDENDPERDFFIQERIRGKTFYDFCTDGCSDEEWMAVVLQLLVAINFAQFKLNFTHYDLHSSNSIVSRIPSKTSIVFVLPLNDQATIYIPTLNNVPKIIDFGRAHIRHIGDQAMPGDVRKISDAIGRDYQAQICDSDQCFLYRDGTDKLSMFKYSPIYDAVNVLRSGLHRFPGHVSSYPDLRKIRTNVMKWYGGSDPDNPSVPRTEDGPWKTTLDIIQELRGTVLYRRLVRKACESNPVLFPWKSQRTMSATAQQIADKCLSPVQIQNQI